MYAATRPPPPPEYAASYRTLRERYGPPSAYELSGARTPPGVSAYPKPPSGCYWASGVLWWQITSGTVLLRALDTERAHNGHRWVRTVRADLYLSDGTELDAVGLPSSSLSRDVEPLREWTPLRVIRDGLRRPWRAVTVPASGTTAWHELAEQLNERGP